MACCAVSGHQWQPGSDYRYRLSTYEPMAILDSDSSAAVASRVDGEELPDFTTAQYKDA